MTTYSKVHLLLAAVERRRLRLRCREEYYTATLGNARMWSVPVAGTTHLDERPDER